MKSEKMHPKAYPHSKQPFTFYNPPIVPLNYYPSIVFESVLAAYFCVLIYLNLSPSMSNLRVVLYALLYFVNQCLTHLVKVEEAVDELGLFPMKNLLMHLQKLVKANMLYLLVRLLINTYSLSAVVLLVLFLIANLSKFKKIGS